jgi:hypothetical protein
VHDHLFRSGSLPINGFGNNLFISALTRSIGTIVVDKLLEFGRSRGTVSGEQQCITTNINVIKTRGIVNKENISQFDGGGGIIVRDMGARGTMIVVDHRTKQ